MDTVPQDKYPTLSDDSRELLEQVLASVEHAIHNLYGIKLEIMQGEFTQERASITADEMMFVEGLDFISIIRDYAENADYTPNPMETR